MRALKATSALIDGEAVWCGPDGAADFDKLHSRAHDDQVFMYAFDLLELNGVNRRPIGTPDRHPKGTPWSYVSNDWRSRRRSWSGLRRRR
jgi:hypothetical protein